MISAKRAERRVKKALKRGVKRGDMRISANKDRENGPKADVRISVSPVMLIMAAVFVAFGMAYEYSCSLAAVILHELCHAKVAKKLGYALNEVKIMPYGAALCGSEDISPKHEILIAVAGPAFNLILGMIFAAMWWLIPSSYMFTETFCKCNIYIGLFNLLPVYPLDGGRIALAAMSFKLGHGRAYKVSRIVSAVFGFASIGLFALSAMYDLNLCFLTVGLFMVLSAFIPNARARYYALFSLGGRKLRLNRPLEVRRFAVSQNAQLIELCAYLDPDRYTVFDICDGNMKFYATLSETELINAVGDSGYYASAESAVSQGGTKNHRCTEIP